jgi:adenylate kinase
MTIFVAGVYGAGKTTLCARLAQELAYFSTSASTLIRESRGEATWNRFKETRRIQSNQQLLISAVTNLRKKNNNILLDGHFALLNSDGHVEKIDHCVFYDLCIDAIILIEDEPADIAHRLTTRDGSQWDRSTVEALMRAERENAFAFHRASNVPLKIFRGSTYFEILAYLSEIVPRN